MFLELCLGSFSKLPELEPILGAALALNSAYLALDRFRHRIKIRNHASRKLEIFQPNGEPPPKRLTDSKYYKTLALLAGLPDNDKEVGQNGGKAKVPMGWGTVYGVLFHNHHDRHVAWLFVGVASILLIVGVGHATSIDQFSQCLFTVRNIGWSFFLGLVMIAYPTIAAWLGFNVVRSLTVYCTDEVDELNKLLTEQIPEAAEDLDEKLKPQSDNAG